MKTKIIHGDAIEQLGLFSDNLFDSIVTDPPAGISFMNKKWDDDKGGRDHWIKWLSEVFIEAKRTLKPGGHALVWALPRTSHWTAMALEDAGFEIRDCIYHVFGSGFPKSMDISKQIDKRAGAEREVIGQREDILTKQAKDLREGKRKIVESLNAGAPERNNGFVTVSADVTAPSTPEAKQWSGWGTALKPAVECWWLVRKPISEKTVAENVLKWGVGGLNIDGCRVQTNDNLNGGAYSMGENDAMWSKNSGGGGFIKKPGEFKQPTGRFPANLIHDGSDEVLAEFAKFGEKKGMSGGGEKTQVKKDSWIVQPFNRALVKDEWIRGDSGTAARFFYCAKPSRAERDMGLDNYPILSGSGNTMGRNNHPTVKAQALMKYLIKLITPPGGIVLDMFAGSGSTLVAADGFIAIGIEQELENCKIAEQRLNGKLKGQLFFGCV